MLDLYDKKNKELFLHLRDLAYEYEDQPLSLSELCRFQIRCRLVDVRDETINQLPLPKIILKYVALADTDIWLLWYRGEDVVAILKVQCFLSKNDSMVKYSYNNYL